MAKIDYEAILNLLEEYNKDVLNTDFELIYNFPNYFPAEKEIVLYTDTDSQFLVCPLNEKIITNYETLSNIFANIFARLVNAQNFEPQSKNNPPVLNFKFKNEFSLIAIIFYGKKMYVAFKVSEEKLKNLEDLKKEDIKISYTGLEGKKGTQKIVENIFNEFLDIIIDFIIQKQKITYEKGLEITENTIRKYIKRVKELNEMWQKKENLSYVIEQLGLPINISKDLDNLDAISSYYRGTVAFDVLVKPIFPEGYWQNKKGRSRHIYVKIKNEEKALEIYKKLLEFKSIKISSVGEIKDISIPEEYSDNEEILSLIASQTEINIIRYLDIIIRKIQRLYTPITISEFKFPSYSSSSKTRPSLIFSNNGICYNSASKSTERKTWRDFVQYYKLKTSEKNLTENQKEKLKKIENDIVKEISKTDEYYNKIIKKLDKTVIDFSSLRPTHRIDEYIYESLYDISNICEIIPDSIVNFEN